MYKQMTTKKIFSYAIAAVALLVLPLLVQPLGGNYWMRVIDMVLLYIMLALGLNIVVGFAGLLDLGYVAFYAVGAYLFALLASPHLSDNFEAIAAMFPNGLHFSLWIALPIAALLAGIAGVILGAPTLKLRGDYLAIVTLGFGEIIRIFMENLNAPINLTNGLQGIGPIDKAEIFGHSFANSITVAGVTFNPLALYYYMFLVLVLLVVLVSYRLQDSRIGRAWMAVREDEIAAKAMGLNTRNLKLMAFGMGATFGGIAGVLFAAIQGFVTPKSFNFMESVMIVGMVVLGGLGHIPGVIVGAIILAAMPEVFRSMPNDITRITGGRIDPAILRQLLISTAMIGIMLLRPRGIWPAPEHGKMLEEAAPDKSEDTADNSVQDATDKS